MRTILPWLVALSLILPAKVVAADLYSEHVFRLQHEQARAMVILESYGRHQVGDDWETHLSKKKIREVKVHAPVMFRADRIGVLVSVKGFYNVYDPIANQVLFEPEWLDAKTIHILKRREDDPMPMVKASLQGDGHILFCYEPKIGKYVPKQTLQEWVDRNFAWTKNLK